MLKDLFGDGLMVYVKNKDGRFIPVYLKVDLKTGGNQLVVSTVVGWGQKLAEESFKAVKELDEHLHSIGIHEKEGCPNIDQSKKIIIDLK